MKNGNGLDGQELFLLLLGIILTLICMLALG